MCCTGFTGPSTLAGREKPLLHTRRSAHRLREVTDVENTTYSTSMFALRAVTRPAAAAGLWAVKDRMRAHVMRTCVDTEALITRPLTVQGTSVPAFGPRVGQLAAQLNKSIVFAPLFSVVVNDTDGVSGIRSWSPPV